MSLMAKISLWLIGTYFIAVIAVVIFITERL